MNLGTVVAFANGNSIKLGVVFEKKTSLVDGIEVETLGVRFKGNTGTEVETVVKKDEYVEARTYNSSEIYQLMQQHAGGDWAEKESDRLKGRIPDPAPATDVRAPSSPPVPTADEPIPF